MKAGRTWEVDFLPPGVEATCDFCSSEAVAAERSAAAGELDREALAVLLSRSGWIACPECARLIDADYREVLARRALRIIAGSHGLSPAELSARGGLRVIREAHARFFAARDKGT